MCCSPRRRSPKRRGHDRAEGPWVRGRGHARQGVGTGDARGRADGADGGESRGSGGRRADQHPHRLLGARALRRERATRRRGPCERAGEAARQPDALPRDGGGGLRRAPLRLGRGDARRAAAAHGPAVCATLPELRGPIRAAGRGPEPDRPRAERGRRRPSQERRAHGRRRAQARGRGERPRRGALPDGRRARRHGADPGRRRLRRVGRRRRGGAAGVDARDDRGLRQLRRDRRGRGGPAGAAPRRRPPRARRARDHDVLDGTPGPDGRSAVPRRLSVRVRGAALVARARRRGAQGRAGRVPGRGTAGA